MDTPAELLYQDYRRRTLGSHSGPNAPPNVIDSERKARWLVLHGFEDLCRVQRHFDGLVISLVTRE